MIEIDQLKSCLFGKPFCMSIPPFINYQKVTIFIESEAKNAALRFNLRYVVSFSDKFSDLQAEGLNLPEKNLADRLPM